MTRLAKAAAWVLAMAAFYTIGVVLIADPLIKHGVGVPG